MSKDFPSLDTECPAPHGWVQWKGTDVCCDIHCECGEHTHFDGMFMYYVKCPHCGQVYECGGHIKLYPIDHEPQNTKLLEKDLI